MRYSLIIPHHNIPDKLRRLLSTLPVRDDLEVIVVDDCSDKNIAGLEAVKNEFPHVKFLTTTVNGGGGKARNIGLAHAQGDYLIFADADDFFLPSLSVLLDKYKDEDHDMVIFNAISLMENTMNVSHRNDHLSVEISKLMKSENKDYFYFRYRFGEPWCRIIKRAIVESENIRFDEIPKHNDAAFAYKVGAYANDVVVDNTAAYCIIDRPDSVSKRIGDDIEQLRLEVFAKKHAYLKQHGVDIFDSPISSTFVVAVKQMDRDKLKSYFAIAKKYGISKWDIIREAFKNKLRL